MLSRHHISLMICLKQKGNNGSCIRAQTRLEISKIIPLGQHACLFQSSSTPHPTSDSLTRRRRPIQPHTHPNTIRTPRPPTIIPRIIHANMILIRTLKPRKPTTRWPVQLHAYTRAVGDGAASQFLGVRDASLLGIAFTREAPGIADGLRGSGGFGRCWRGAGLFWGGYV